jgi:two-component system sensor histidine kinase UhpB
VRPDSSSRWVAVREFPIAGDLGRDDGLLGLVEDVTERREMEEQSRRLEGQLRRLARRLDEAREKERKKLAIWLHDEVGQLLTALRLDLAWLGGRMPAGSDEIRVRLAEMQRLIEDRITAVQQISIELRPSILEDLGLRAAIEWACGQHEARTGTAVKVDNAVSDPDVPRPVALAVLRITQEALTNIARHAGASCVWLTLRRDESRILLTVADNGRGIRPDEAAGFGALGILGMRERTMACGGTFDVRRHPGGGTEVRATMRLERSAEEE